MSSRDDRTQREKLEAMANQTVSPHEAETARHILFKRYGPTRKPPRYQDMTKDEVREYESRGRESFFSHEEEWKPSKPPAGWFVAYSGNRRGAHTVAQRMRKGGTDARVAWRMDTDLANKAYPEWRVFGRHKSIG